MYIVNPASLKSNVNINRRKMFVKRANLFGTSANS